MKNLIATAIITICLPLALYGQTGTLFNVDTPEGVTLTMTVTSATAMTCSVYAVGTLAESAEGKISVPATANGYRVTGIGRQAFYNCGSMHTLTLPEGLETIGDNAFHNCSGMTTLNIPSTVVSIGAYAFHSCTRLTTITLPDGVESIGEGTFNNCTSLTTASIPSSLTTLPDNTFYNCKSLTTVSPLSVTSIGKSAFYNTQVETLTITSSTVATLGSALSGMLVYVPQALYSDYLTADVWNTFSENILPISCTTNYDLTLQASPSSSSLLNAIGEGNAKTAVDLKITGNINSYDIVVIRNKMPNLRILDISAATIVASTHEYYQGYTTEDNVVGKYMFSGLSSLKEVKLPTTTEAISQYAFYNCSRLCVVTIGGHPKTVGAYAFYRCSKLASIALPEGIEEIGNSAFASSGLTTATLPSTLKVIGQQAFYLCKIAQLTLPQSVQSIGASAFYGNTALTAITIPSAVRSIGDKAFAACTNLKTYYSNTIEPVKVTSNTFSNYSTARLYVPTQSYDLYSLNAEWSKFASINRFTQACRYFYLYGDYQLSGLRISGIPDADIYEQASLTVDGNATQMLGNVCLHSNGTDMPTIIGNGNISATSLAVEIDVKPNKWYFLGMPFDADIAAIEAPGLFVIRHYDADIRARYGSGGWTDLPAATTQLEAGKGYIFQSNAGGTLRIKARQPSFSGNDSTLPLALHCSEYDEDASWNFIGNPFMAYTDINTLGYEAPITVWNGSGYDAYLPGDDNYVLRPMEAFFVQKPSDVDNITFSAANRMTHTEAISASNRVKGTGLSGNKRHVITLTLSSGSDIADHTRIVLDDTKTCEYEIGFDAAKFMTTGKPQLFTTCNGTRYSINQRNSGKVSLGVSAPEATDLTIAATRLDCQLTLLDTQTGKTTNLSDGCYTFHYDGNASDSRFVLTPTEDADVIETAGHSESCSISVEKGGLRISDYSDGAVEVFSADGKKIFVSSCNTLIPLPSGMYVVKTNDFIRKVVIR